MKPLIVISGPTAAGKSACALELALITGGELVSADSMQVYKYMNIGTAKPTPLEMSQVPHYLIDVVEPDFSFNAAVFTTLAKKAIDDIHLRNKIPILVGGTGFYINALIYQNNFSDSIASSEIDTVRIELYDLYEKKGKEYLYNLLESLDSQYAALIHMNNVKRVIRAIEYYKQTGEKFSDYINKNKSNRKPAYELSEFIIYQEREKLYETINNRVDTMIEMGLVSEVGNLVNMGYSPHLTSMQGLGYKEIYPHIIGEYDLEYAINILKQGTRRFAKRQNTWFKNQSTGTWLNTIDFKDSVEIARKVLEMSKI